MDGVIRADRPRASLVRSWDLRFDPSTFMTQWTAARVKTRIERTESAIATAPTTARLRAAITGASLMPQMSCGERALLARALRSRASGSQRSDAERKPRRVP